MTTFVGRLLRGYVSLARGGLYFLAIAVVVAAASGAIALPIWALARSAPIVLNVFVGAAVLFAIVRVVGLRLASWTVLLSLLAIAAGLFLALPLLSIAGGALLISRAALSLNGR